MNGFSQAQADYERSLNCPFDFGGALFDYDEYEREREEYAEKQAEMMLDEIWSD